MLGNLRRRHVDDEVRAAPGMSWEAVQNLFSVNGHLYSTFRAGEGRHLVRECGPVYAVLDRRISVMGDARPMWQRLRNGRPDELYSTRDLEVLRRPWPGGTWRHLVAACEADVATCGNSYWTRLDGRLVRLNPDWVTIVTGDVEIDGVKVGEELLGYVVQRHGRNEPGITLEPAQVAHYRPGAPVESAFRGESWLAAVAYDASSDLQLTHYKGNYLKNGAMPSLAVTYEPTIPQETLEAFVPVFAEKFTGSLNAGKVMHFLGGRDVKTVGATLDQLAFKAVQGAGETRIAAAAGVPAVVAGFSEGMQGSSLNAGNYVATRRLFADAKIRPLLGALCEAFAALLPAPGDSRLWYDDSDVSFFQEDVADDANIKSTLASTMRQLIEAGYTPDSVKEAVTSGRFEHLEHTGLTSVQLLQPGSVGVDGNGNDDSGGSESSDPEHARKIAEIIQKIYLGVGVVLTPDEAREIVNRAGADLPDGVDPTSVLPPRLKPPASDTPSEDDA